MQNKEHKEYSLGNPRRSLIEIIKYINDNKIIVDIMSIKGIDKFVRKPKWFLIYEKKQDEFNKFVVCFIKQQEEFNKQQEKFNKLLMKRLDNVDYRLDNLVKKNNLEE